MSEKALQVYKYDGQFMRECLQGHNLQKMSRDYPALKIATLYRARAGEPISPDSIGALSAILKKKPGQFFKLENHVPDFEPIDCSKE